MASVNYPKTYESGSYPVHVKDPTGLLTRVEPMLTPEMFRSRFLKGMDRLFAIAGVTFSDEEIKDYINLAIGQAENLTDSLFFAERKIATLPLDQNLAKSWMFSLLPDNILELYSYSLTTADQASIFTLPAAYIDASQFNRRIITIIPLLSSAANQVVASSTSSPYGWPFYQRLWGFHFIPSFIRVDYLSGMIKEKGQTPTICNELIGTLVCLRILAMLLALFPYQSQSLSVDGISQSSGLSIAFLNARIDFLEKNKMELVGKIKKVFSNKYYLSNI